MASDIFAKLGDIKGESIDDKHKDEIEVFSFPSGTDRIQLAKLDLNLTIDYLTLDSPSQNEVHFVHVEKSTVRVPALFKELKLSIRLAEDLVMARPTPHVRC